MSLPTMTATGRVTAQPELRTTPSGSVICRLRLACVERRRDRDTGRWFDAATTSLDVDLHGPLAPATAATLAMGDLVTASGYLTQRERNGHSYYTLKAEAVGRIPNKSEAA